MKLTMVTALLLTMSATLMADLEVNPDVFKLKTYRSYYHFTLESAEKHQFEIWHGQESEGSVEWDFFHAGVGDEAEARALRENQYLSPHAIIAGWPQPPKEIAPIPAAIQPIADALREAVKLNHPKSNAIKIVYFGKLARIAVTELVPTKEHDGKATFRMGFETNHNYFVDLEKKTLKSFGSMGTGLGMLDIPKSASSTEAVASWLDYSLAPEVEGSVILGLRWTKERAGKAHKDAKAKLDKYLMQQAIAANAGELEKVELDDILARQGSSILPPYLTQNLEFRFSIYARHSEEQGDYEAEFIFPVKEGELSNSAEFPELGIKLSMKLNLFVAKPYAEVVIEDKYSSTKTIDLAVDQSKLVKVVEGESKMVMHLIFNQEVELELPGRKGYESVDVYSSRSEAFPYKLTGKVKK